MSCGVVLCAVVGIDAVVSSVLDKNAYTLRSGGGAGIAMNVMTLVVCLVFGTAFYGMNRIRRDEGGTDRP